MTGEKIEQVIAAIGLMLVAIFMLSTAFPVSAGGRGHDNDRDTPSVYHYGKNLRGEDVAKGIAIGAVLTCVVRSVWSRLGAGRWTWCGDDRQLDPIPDPGPAVVTPDSLRAGGS